MSTNRDRAREILEALEGNVGIPGLADRPEGALELVEAALERAQRDALARATGAKGAAVVAAWRDRPLRSAIGSSELGDLEWLIDETVLGARLEVDRSLADAARELAHEVVESGGHRMSRSLRVRLERVLELVGRSS
jgi:hypothetical protein